MRVFKEDYVSINIDYHNLLSPSKLSRTHMVNVAVTEVKCVRPKESFRKCGHWTVCSLMDIAKLHICDPVYLSMHHVPGHRYLMLYKTPSSMQTSTWG